MDKIKTGMKLLIFVWIYYIVCGNFKYKYIKTPVACLYYLARPTKTAMLTQARTPVTRTLKGNEKLSE